MKVSRLLCLLLPIQDGQLKPAMCLNWNDILKWYFLKYYQVRGSQVFLDTGHIYILLSNKASEPIFAYV